MTAPTTFPVPRPPTTRLTPATERPTTPMRHLNLYSSWAPDMPEGAREDYARFAAAQPAHWMTGRSWARTVAAIAGRAPLPKGILRAVYTSPDAQEWLSRVGPHARLFNLTDHYVDYAGPADWDPPTPAGQWPDTDPLYGVEPSGLFVRVTEWGLRGGGMDPLQPAVIRSGDVTWMPPENRDTAVPIRYIVSKLTAEALLRVPGPPRGDILVPGPVAKSGKHVIGCRQFQTITR